MERKGPRNFSIEPYVEASGVLGDRLVVDEAAASSIMRRTALRRDFSVTKGYFREAREFEGDEVLAISTASVHNERQVSEVGGSAFSTLVRHSDQWVMYLHDQELDDKINDWGKKHYKPERGKNWQGVYREEFVRMMRSETMAGLRGAFWDEKKEIFTYPFKYSNRALLLMSALLYSFVLAAGDFVVNDRISGEGYSSEDILPALLISASAIYFSMSLATALENLEEVYSVKKGVVNKVESIVPNPQLPSSVMGVVSLILNSNRLIRLKQS